MLWKRECFPQLCLYLRITYALPPSAVSLCISAASGGFTKNAQSIPTSLTRQSVEICVFIKPRATLLNRSNK